MPALRGPCSFVTLQGIGRWGGGCGFTLLIGAVSVPGGVLLLSESIK